MILHLIDSPLTFVFQVTDPELTSPKARYTFNPRGPENSSPVALHCQKSEFHCTSTLTDESLLWWEVEKTDLLARKQLLPPQVRENQEGDKWTKQPKVALASHWQRISLMEAQLDI